MVLKMSKNIEKNKELTQGTWVLESDDSMPDPMFKLVVCSRCKETANHTYRFCPNCGVPMGEEVTII